MKHFVVTALATTIFAFLVLATVSGRWTKDKELRDIWNEVGLWETCVCTDLTRGECQTRNDYLRTVQAFSLIQVSAEGFGVALLLAEWFISRGARSVWFFILLSFLAATAANIVSWTTYSSFYRKRDVCLSTEPSFKDLDYKLSWGFGVRLVEFGLLIVLSLLTFVNMGKGSNERTGLLFGTLFIALFILTATIVTTSGRGWMYLDETNDSWDRFVGIFDGCNCRQNYDIQCEKAKSRVQGAETFSVAAIVLQFGLVKLLLKGTPSLLILNVQRVLTAVIFGFILITLATFAEFASSVQCGSAALTDSQRFHWAFALQAVSLIGEAFLFVFLIAIPVVPEQKPTEPAA